MEEADCRSHALEARVCRTMRSKTTKMTHPINRSDRPSGHRPVRAIVWLTGAVLLFGGVATADRLDRDPVEKFRQALLLEKAESFRNPLKGETLEKALAFRKSNLEKTADAIVSLSDLSRALLLVDWPLINAEIAGDRDDNKDPKKDKDIEKDPDVAKTPKNFDVESRKILTAVRSKMAIRFNKGIAGILSGSRSSEATKIAVANLVGETLMKASTQDDILKKEKGEASKKSRLIDDIDFKTFAKHLSKLTENSSSRVDVSVAGALGQFREQPKIVGPALKRLLASDRSEATRLAASTALLNLSSSISNKLSLRGSEPGVTPVVPSLYSRPLESEEILDSVKRVTDAASLGLGDSSVAVRRHCITAMRNVAGEVSGAILPSLTEKILPPKERENRSAEEIADIKAEHLALDKRLEPVTAALEDYSKNYTSALATAVRDSDATVRVEARNTLRELAHVRQTMRDLRDALPEEQEKPKLKEKVKPKADDDLSRRKSTKDGTIRLMADTIADRPKTLPILAPLSGVRILKQAPAAKTDGITGLLDEIGAGLISDGIRDPNEQVRRAAHEAIEALGRDAVKYAPELAKSLEDSDVFVRWIAARILRKIAVNDERRNQTPEHTEQVIPALIKGLEDEDLDGRIAVTRALGAYGPAAKSAVPALAKLLGKGDAEYRIVALKALEGIGEESKSALTEVVAGFENTDPRVRAESARLVGQLHKFSSSHLEALEKLANDPDPKVREAAGSAILLIQPD